VGPDPRATELLPPDRAGGGGLPPPSHPQGWGRRLRPADASAPFGVVGLYAGTPAAYAVRGQSITFYESHPELKELVADTDRHFTFLRDARRRGATVDVTFGPVRKTLTADADKRFKVLLVELFETGFDPGDRLTLEAVRLYFDRVTPDGLVALHVSNREHRLEPVVERIARELKLAGRVWYDDDGPPGKATSGWVVLARTEAALGPLTGSNIEQIKEFSTRNEALNRLLWKYPSETRAMEAILAEYGGAVQDRQRLTPTFMSIRQGHQASVLFQWAIRLRDRGERDVTLARLTEVVCGRMFRPLVAGNVPLRTDAHRPPLPGANDPP
jgi:hypothetical protein